MGSQRKLELLTSLLRSKLNQLITIVKCPHRKSMEWYQSGVMVCYVLPLPTRGCALQPNGHKQIDFSLPFPVRGRNLRVSRYTSTAPSFVVNGVQKYILFAFETMAEKKGEGEGGSTFTVAAISLANVFLLHQ